MPSATENRTTPCSHRTPGGKSTNSKRLIVCCDGTWNDSNTGDSPATNVSRLSGAIAHKCCSGMPQVVYYRTGAGTEASWVARQLGGLFGQGVIQDVVECYRFICDNYNPGDEIILVGFSRGAFTARSVAAMVCALGFLNRAGLDQLSHIFHDYSVWTTWSSGTAFSEAEHLAGFTLENSLRVNKLQKARKSDAVLRSEEGVANDLLEQKKKLYAQIVGMNKDAESIAKAYREMLVKHEMASARRTSRGTFEPVEGTIRAVGVWDTVGSLGIPKSPIFGKYSGRHEAEVRFQSLDVHPHIDYAFHALALDETRTAFGPTMWGLKGNDHTELRQVWFPGNHSNVGGGWPDQQIATIALAWMADQLTSIGVEFNKNEMARIFYRTHPGSDIRPWGLGKICASHGATAIPDKLWNTATWPISKLKGQDGESLPRLPGLYKEDDGKSALKNSNEFIHPSVRIRLAHEGLDLDDSRKWKCRALTMNSYELVPDVEPSPDRKKRDGRIKDVLQPYYTVSGATLPFFDAPGADPFAEEAEKYSAEAASYSAEAGMGAPRHVRVEQPWDSDLHECKTPKKYYVWRSKKTGRTLPEEHIGIWERMFAQINAKKLEWAADQLAAKKKAQAEAEARRWRISKWVFGSSPDPAGNGKQELEDVVSWQTANMSKKPVFLRA